MMATEIPYLKPGDLIRIVSPAKAIEHELLTHAKHVLEALGFRVKIGKNAGNRWNYFSGTDSDRLADMQEAIDDPECKAILCARGGYGCVRIVDLINWAGFLRAPKWMIGFSDVTVFHHHIQRFNIPSIHATMPLNFKENTQEALNSLVAAISGTKNEYRWQTNTSKSGEVEGKVIGGNLSIVYSLLGTDDQLYFENSILFIEDLGEQLYALDRMIHSLSKGKNLIERVEDVMIDVGL
jgi:muramoyltetrapeptide carboxypeptidase